MKMATLEEEKSRGTAIQFRVQTIMTSNDSFKQMKAPTYTVVFRGALFLNGIVDLEISGQKVHSMEGNHS